MYTYRILPTNQRSLPLLVDSQTFTEEWKACWEDKSRNMTTLMEYAIPMFKHWDQLLSRTAAPDINMISLCAQLAPDSDHAIHKIKKCIHWATHNTSVRNELELLFIEHVRKANYFPSFANPRMAEYVIARDFRTRLKDFINRSHIQNTNHIVLDTSVYEIRVEPEHPDYFLLKHLHLNKWESYLLKWISDGNTAISIARASHIPWDTFKHEERNIWRLLKENYSKAEE
jgi:hypothetical protein